MRFLSCLWQYLIAHLTKVGIGRDAHDSALWTHVLPDGKRIDQAVDVCLTCEHIVTSGLCWRRALFHPFSRWVTWFSVRCWCTKHRQRSDAGQQHLPHRGLGHGFGSRRFATVTPRHPYVVRRLLCRGRRDHHCGALCDTVRQFSRPRVVPDGTYSASRTILSRRDIVLRSRTSRRCSARARRAWCRQNSAPSSRSSNTRSGPG